MGTNESPYNPDAFSRYESGFLESEFRYPTSDIQQQFFDGAGQSGDIYSSVVYESNVDSDFVDELAGQQSTFGNVVEVGGKTYVLQIRMFVSRDDSYLSRVFDRTEPKDNEVCLFLEDNSTDLLSPRSYYVKVGDIFRRYLEANRDSLALQGALDNATELVRDGDATVEASFSEAEILTLIRKGSLSGNNAISPFLSVFQTVHAWNAWINDSIGGLILGASEGVKYYMKFADTSWDPEAERKEDSEFQPFLVPGIAITAQDKIRSAFRKGIQTYARSVIDYLDLLARLDFSLLPGGFDGFFESFQTMVAKLKEIAQKFADALVRDLTGMLDFFQGFGEQMLNIINAYYCGLWNSLIDALMAIPDILGYMFKLAALPSKLAQNIDKLVPKVIELMDEMMQAVFTTDWTALISTIISETGKGLLSLLPSAAGYLSWERVAYFMGAVSGFIIENAIGFLLSAGVINIASITAKLGKFGKFVDVIVGLIKGLNRVVNTATEAVFKGIIRVVGWLLSIIRKGAKEAGTLIRTLFAKLASAAKVADEVILSFFKQLGLNAEHLRRLRAAGFEVVDVADGKTAGLIKKAC